MSEATATGALAGIRKERVHTTMLIELLALLVFLAMVFAFVFREEGDRLNPWKEKADQLQQQLDAERKLTGSLRHELTAAQMQIRTLQESISRLVREHQGTLPANDYVTVPKSLLGKMSDKAAGDQAMLDELRKENERLRAQLTVTRGKGGTDLPNCQVTAGFLVNVDLYEDGAFRVTPAWNAGAVDAVHAVTGLERLAKGARVDRNEFGALASQVSGWGRAQKEPCGFRAKVLEHHSDLTLYKRQVGLVEQYFYVRRN